MFKREVILFVRLYNNKYSDFINLETGKVLIEQNYDNIS